MKVLFVFNSGNIRGGGEIMFINLIEEIKNMVDQKKILLTPLVFIPSKGKIEEIILKIGIKPFILPLPSLKSLLNSTKAFFNVLKFLTDVNPDILHINGSRAMIYFGILGKILNKKIVWHVRIIDKDIIDPALYLFADKIIVNSYATKGRFSYLPKYKKKVEVVYNGIKKEILKVGERKLREEMRERRGVNQEGGNKEKEREKFFVVSIGRLEKAKGFDYFLLGAKEVLEQRKDVSFLIVGDGPERENLQKLAKELKISVEFLGWRDDIPDILSRSHIFVLSSLREHFGNVILEAMACGVPVIATREGGVPEIIEDGKDGILIKPRSPKDISSSILKLLQDKKLYESIRKNAYEKAKKFTIEKHALKILKIYENI